MVKIIEVKTEDIIPYENNPRLNNSAVEAVANSIREFGFKVPIVLDKENVIVSGHTRLKAAEMLGLDKVPCIIADDLTEAQIKAFRLADNKTAELAEWDIEKLEQELKEIESQFNMEDFGFLKTEEAEIDDFFEMKPQNDQEKKPETITCPYCGKEFER